MTFVVFEDLMGRLKIYFYIFIVCDNERGVLRKEFEPGMCREEIPKGKKDNKE